MSNKRREVTIKRADGTGNVITCHDFQIIHQSPTHCSLLILGEEVGKNEEGQMMRNIDGHEYGVTSWYVEEVEVDE